MLFYLFFFLESVFKYTTNGKLFFFLTQTENCCNTCIFKHFFFGQKWGVRGSNPCPCINYAMSLPTEVNSQGLVFSNFNME